MNVNDFHVGAFVLGGTDAPRALLRHADLLAAYADGTIDDPREAYLSHFAYERQMRRHFATSNGSVAGYAGPCVCRHLVFDIDRGDLSAALVDARKLVVFLHRRYPDLEGDIPVYFSGGKGFHVFLELAHRPPPAVGFCRTAKALAEGIAANAGVTLDLGIYFVNALVRLPNTRHPKTGLFKRRVDADDLFRLDIDGIRDRARHPAGDGLPTAKSCPDQLAADWQNAEERATRTAESRAVQRAEAAGTPDARAPKYFLDLLRFGVDVGERHRTLFRCAAWLTEQGAPAELVSALLTEPGRDVGLTPTDVDRQIRCGIEHAHKQRVATAAPIPPSAGVPVAADPPPVLADLEVRVRRAGLTWDAIRDHFDAQDDYVPHAGTLSDLTGRQQAAVDALITARAGGGGAA